MAHRPFLLPLALFALPACSSDGGNPTETEAGILVAEVSLPVPGTAYRGDEAHLFMDGQVTLFCGTHGVFSDAVDPPEQVGQSVMSEYTATFVGELVLAPPAVSSPVTHSLTVQARMAERITLREISGGTLTFDTELVTFELGGSDMPAGVVVRESPDLASAGVTTITPVSGGRSRVETTYDVWLEISLDGGRSWSEAQQAVRMTLQPG